MALNLKPAQDKCHDPCGDEKAETLSSSASLGDCDPNLCRGCRSPKRRYNLRASGDADELCRRCRMRRDRFSDASVKTLQTCPDIQLPAVRGVTGCPSLRACPTCGILLQHDDQFCKKVVCPRCAAGFCFVCLKRTEQCLQTSGPYKQCSSGVAPRQRTIPVWQHK